MEPEDTEVVDTPDAPDVVVVVNSEPDNEPDDAPDTTVVVVDAGDDGASDGEIDRAVETERRFAALETRIGEVADLAYEALSRSAVAEVIAEDTIIEDLPDTNEDADEDDDNDEDEVVPENKHPLFRSFSDWGWFSK